MRQPAEKIGGATRLGVVKDSIQILKLAGWCCIALSLVRREASQGFSTRRQTGFFGWPWGGCPMMTEIAMPIAKADNRVDTIG